jgi:hypothetical protein
LAGIIAGLAINPNEKESEGFGAGGAFFGNRQAGGAKIKDEGLRTMNRGPSLLGFRGDLAIGGSTVIRDQITPFVVGSCLTLDVDWRNAVAFRWTCNGQVVLDKNGEEWGPRPQREYEVKDHGKLSFTVQARGDDVALVSTVLQREIDVEPLYIVEFSPHITDAGDERRVLTGDDYTVQVDMFEPQGDVEYLFRYFINNRPIKHPEDGKEWTPEESLTYAFPVPGTYAFRVEVRRADQEKAEASASLPSIVVADAVLLSFDATPENTGQVGGEVYLDAFDFSLYGDTRCRFGFMLLKEGAAFEWIPDGDGNIWGESSRSWRPTEPGNYKLRVEIRDTNGDEPDDFREISSYVVTSGDVEF